VSIGRARRSGSGVRLVVDGGRVAARGFQYQYLRTLEAMLDLIGEPEVTAVRIEGPHGRLEGPTVDAIDFDVTDGQGRTLLASQVKSRTSGTWSGPEAMAVFFKLITTSDAARYELLASGRASASGRAVADALDSGSTGEALRDRLLISLAASPQRQADLQELDTEGLDRLSRCRVFLDDRDGVEAVRADLHHRLRAFRNGHRQGLGDRSAGLLLGYLMDQILRRAADSRYAEFTLDEFRDLLLVDSNALAFGTGARDWGRAVGQLPPIPDVVRSDLLTAVEDGLNSCQTPGVRRVALVGLSGIGKSSLAAAYAADHADSYDWILWIDAETLQSLHAGVQQIVTNLHPELAALGVLTHPQHWRTALHHVLSGFAGRWLMVFDNVGDQRSAEAWIPRLGRGDVLTTSIDATARHGSSGTISVGQMQAGEAVQLLRRRLGVPVEGGETDSGTLGRLAERLSYWPLALELAAGYMQTCGIGLEDVDRYVEKMAGILDDDASVPPGYPRTLVAAVRMCVEDMVSRIPTDGGTGADRTRMQLNLALGMLAQAAYLSPRRMPIHLLAAGASYTPLPEEGVGTIFIDPAQADLGPCVRELRRYSLVGFDDDVPPADKPVVPDENRTITVNSVVQEITRSFHKSLAPADLRGHLSRLADHMGRWMFTALTLSELHRLPILFQHAVTLGRHLRHLGVQENTVAVLYGNIAHTFRLHGDLSAAEDWLRTELTLLERLPNPDLGLIVMTKLTLAEILLAGGQGSERRVEAVGHLEHSLTLIGHRPASSHYVMDDLAFRGLVAIHAAAGPPTPHLTALRHQFASFCIATDQITPSSLMNRLHRANDALTQGDPLTAERLTRGTLATNALVGGQELEAQRLLAEALAVQGRWQEATRVSQELMDAFGGSPIHIGPATSLVHNVGLVAALAVHFTDTTEALHLVRSLTCWTLLPRILKRCDPGMRARITLLCAFTRTVDGDRTGRGLIDPIADDDLGDGVASLRAWTLLRKVVTEG
jgi:hypothetical protein